MKDPKFKSLNEDVSSELNEKVFRAALPELSKNEAHAAKKRFRRSSLGWLFGGFATAGLAALIGLQALRKPQGDSQTDFAEFALDPDLDFAELDEDFELFEDDAFEEFLKNETEG